MIDLTHGLNIEKSPLHYISFGYFVSRRFSLNLYERTAITPNEKEVVTSIPYMQGVVDMSNLIGNRVYENREIRYTFYRFGVEKNTAQHFQTTIENLLMGQFDTRLDDTYEPDFHYIGKCKDVTVTDEYTRNRIKVEITFDLYPFKIDNRMESADLFDPFNFDLDAFQNDLRFIVTNEKRNILLYNTSQRTINPLVRADVAGAVLESDGISHNLLEGTFTYPNLRLKPGINEIVLSQDTDDTITVWFDWRKERI